MNTAELTALLDRLRAEPRETEWLEFKTNRHDPQVLGEYLSALANSACLLGKPRAYLVFGIQDGSHAVVGTTFDLQAETGKGKQLLSLWLSLGLHPNVGFETHTFLYRGKRVVLFEVQSGPFLRQGVCPRRHEQNRAVEVPGKGAHDLAPPRGLERVGLRAGDAGRSGPACHREGACGIHHQVPCPGGSGGGLG